MQDHAVDTAAQPVIALAELPMLDMRVGLYGSTRHVEVGGQVCFGAVITLAIHKSR